MVIRQHASHMHLVMHTAPSNTLIKQKIKKNKKKTIQQQYIKYIMQNKCLTN